MAYCPCIYIVSVSEMATRESDGKAVRLVKLLRSVSSILASAEDVRNFVKDAISITSTACITGFSISDRPSECWCVPLTLFLTVPLIQTICPADIDRLFRWLPWYTDPLIIPIRQNKTSPPFVSISERRFFAQSF